MAVGRRESKIVALFANKLLAEETAQDNAHADDHQRPRIRRTI